MASRQNRNEFLLESGEGADCKMVVGIGPNRQEFNTHKLILTISSPVFAKMLYGANSVPEIEPGSNITLITITDFDVQTVRSMLRFIYMEEVEQCSTPKELIDLYNAAKQYRLKCTRQCVEFLDDHFTSKEDIEEIYEFSKINNEKELVATCEKLLYIIAHPRDYFKNEDFVKEDPEIVNKIYGLDKLNCTKEELFNALQRYSKANPNTPTNFNVQPPTAGFCISFYTNPTIDDDDDSDGQDDDEFE